MPRGLNNWTFKDITDFLKEHDFRLTHTRGSHFYYVGRSGGEPRQTHIQYHGQKSIHPRTLKSVIRQSGIPQAEWLQWGKNG